jgi:hypothetical protein
MLIPFSALASIVAIYSCLNSRSSDDVGGDFAYWWNFGSVIM